MAEKGLNKKAYKKEKPSSKEESLIREKSETTNHFSGRLLFILIMVMILVVYILLIFNKIFIKISYFGHWFLYIIVGLLLFSLIIFMRPLVLSVIRIKKEKREIKKKEKIKRASEREERKEEKLRLKEEKMRRRLLEKKKRREEKLRLKEEKRKRKEEEKRRKLLEREKEKLKEKKPGFFSRLFEKRFKKEEGREIKEEEKRPKKEKIPLVKELSKSLKIEIGEYETDIDVLYKIIEKKGRIKLSAIARYFGIDKRKAEEWAAILEEHKLAEIHYPAIGEPELRRKPNKTV